MLRPAVSRGAISTPRPRQDRGWVQGEPASPRCCPRLTPQRPALPAPPQHGSHICGTQQLPAHTRQIPANPTRNPELGKQTGGCQAGGW